MIRAFAVWLVIIATETVHGILRGILLVPIVGDLPARQIGVLIGSLLIFSVAYLFIRWMAALTKLQFLAMGLLWVVLTVLFEIGLGRLVLGMPWKPARPHRRKPRYCVYAYVEADHRRVRRDPWRVHGVGATIHGGSTLAGGVVARVATSLTTKADDLQHFTGVQIGLVSDLCNSSQYTPFFPLANQQFVPR